MRALHGLLLALAAGSCSSTAVGNPPKALEVDLVGYQQTVAKQLRPAGVTIDRALMVVEKIKVRAGCGTGASVEEEQRGAFFADLLAGGFQRAVEFRNFTARELCRIELKFHRLERDRVPPGAPPELVDRSMLVTGTRTDGCAFRIETEFDDEFKLESRTGAPITLAEGQERFFVAFAINEWVAATQLETLTCAGGQLVVSKDSNPAQYEAFRDAVVRSARLFEDRDDDGQLGGDEDDDDEFDDDDSSSRSDGGGDDDDRDGGDRSGPEDGEDADAGV